MNNFFLNNVYKFYNYNLNQNQSDLGNNGNY